MQGDNKIARIRKHFGFSMGFSSSSIRNETRNAHDGRYIRLHLPKWGDLRPAQDFFPGLHKLNKPALDSKNRLRRC